jgi:hypothetical protein
MYRYFTIRQDFEILKNVGPSPGEKAGRIEFASALISLTDSYAPPNPLSYPPPPRLTPPPPQSRSECILFISTPNIGAVKTVLQICTTFYRQFHFLHILTRCWGGGGGGGWKLGSFEDEPNNVQ